MRGAHEAEPAHPKGGPGPPTSKGSGSTAIGMCGLAQAAKRCIPGRPNHETQPAAGCGGRARGQAAQPSLQETLRAVVPQAAALLGSALYCLQVGSTLLQVCTSHPSPPGPPCCHRPLEVMTGESVGWALPSPSSCRLVCPAACKKGPSHKPEPLDAVLLFSK